jgi:hypothetical protein
MRVVGVLAAAACVAACGRIDVDRLLPGEPGEPGIDGATDGPPDILPTTGRHWVNAQHADPGLLIGARMVFHRALGKVVMYGGDHATGIPPTDPSAAMWAYDGRAWSTLCDPCEPGGLFTPAIAYDSKRDRIVLFGGLDKAGTTEGFWAWDGAWTRIETPATGISPIGRGMAQMAYDERRDRIVLFGGVVGNDLTRYDASVFEYDGTQWTLAVVPSGPPLIGGQGQTAVWNPVTEQIDILEDQGYTADSDISWAWNGAWSKICESCTGVKRRDASMAFDPSPPRTYEIGGYALGTELAGTWERDAQGIRMLSMLPDRRDSIAVAYDAKRDVFVAYGGNGRSCNGNCAETWELIRD